jgi:hypothetical protein
MGGGGIIIIDDAIKETLVNPLVSGQLKPWQTKLLGAFIAKDPGQWSQDERDMALAVFAWAAVNVK